MSKIYKKFSSAFEGYNESCLWPVRFDEADNESALAEVHAHDGVYFCELKIQDRRL